MDMMKKMEMRKKALMNSSKDASGLDALMKKSQMQMPGMDESDSEEEGFVQMMVSPKEREMLMSMREGGEDLDSEEDLETEF